MNSADSILNSQITELELCIVFLWLCLFCTTIEREAEIPAGAARRAVRECEGKNHREREVVAAAPVSPLPKVLPLRAPTFLILSSLAPPHSARIQDRFPI